MVYDDALFFKLIAVSFRASINLRSLLSGSATKKTNDDDVSTSESDIAISSSVRQKFDNVWFSFVYGRWRISRSKYKKKAPLWLLGEFYFTSRPGRTLQKITQSICRLQMQFWVSGNEFFQVSLFIVVIWLCIIAVMKYNAYSCS